MFVRRGEEFLVLRRSRKQGGYWHSVAGALEDGETYAEAAMRELQEETGLQASPSDLRKPFRYRPEPWESHFEVSGPEVAVECFLAEAPAAWEPKLDWEHVEYRWCTREEALGLLFWREPRDVLRGLA